MLLIGLFTFHPALVYRHILTHTYDIYIITSKNLFSPSTKDRSLIKRFFFNHRDIGRKKLDRVIRINIPSLTGQILGPAVHCIILHASERASGVCRPGSPTCSRLSRSRFTFLPFLLSTRL